MRGGSSIDNMFGGDAEKSMFTMSNVRSGSPEENKRRADDVSLLMLDPYFLTRALAMFFWELGRELWEAWRQKRHDVQPRLNRMAHFYPFVRAATYTLLRDISTNIAVMDMMRSAPSIYMLYLGYDEVAHHSGPWTEDAFGDLKRLDRTLARLRQAIKKAPRAYDLIILLPLVGPLIRVLLALVLFVSTWIGAAEAHQTRGRRTVLLPVVAFLILGIGYVAVSMLLSGVEFTLSSVFASLGISAP